MADDKQRALQTLEKLIIDSASGIAEESAVYQKAEDIVKKHPILTATVDALITGDVGGSFNIGENKKIGFAVDPKDKTASLGFKMSFDEGDEVKKGFITPESLKESKKKIVPKEERTVRQAIERRIEQFENKKKLPRAKATTINKEITLTKSYLNKLSQIMDVDTIKMSDLNSEAAITDIMNAAGEKFNLNKKGFHTFAKNVSAIMSSHAGTGHMWAQFRGGKGSLDISITDYTEGVEPERNLKATKSQFNTAAQSLDSIPDWKQGKLANLPEGTAKRFAKIVAVTGIRLEHLAGLTLDDLSQLDEGIIIYDEYKGKKGKPTTTFYNINEAGKRLLKQQMKFVNDPSVRIFGATSTEFSTHFSKFFNDNNLKVTLKNGKTETWQLYDFRRTQKARLIAQGKPQYVIDSLMGHSFKGPYKENIIQGSKMSTDKNVLNAVKELEDDFFEKAGALNKSARYVFTGEPIPQGMEQPKFRVARSTEDLKGQFDKALTEADVSGKGGDNQGKSRKWSKKAKTAGVIAGILGSTKAGAATIASMAIPGPFDLPLELGLQAYQLSDNPPGYDKDSVSLFEEMQDRQKFLQSKHDNFYSGKRMRGRGYQKLSENELLELDELQSFFDNLGFDEDESNKLVKDTKKQYSTKYVEEDLPRMEKESWLNTPDPFATTQEKPIEQTG